LTEPSTRSRLLVTISSLNAEATSMGAMAAPIVPGKLDVFRAWTAELNGPRKAQFEDSNSRHKLTGHHAWLQENPDGSHIAIVVHEGPGADNYLMSIASSDDEFDKWFLSHVVEIHGIDMSGPMPPPAEKFI
jgi:hypothetical protein